MKILNKLSNINIVKTLALLIPLLSSCQDFLEENPPGILTKSNFYKTEADAISAVDALYATIQSRTNGMYWGEFFSKTDVNTDDMFVDPGVGNVAWQEWGRLNIYPEIGQLLDVWNHHYLMIGRANAAIEYISTDLEIRDRLLGEAKFFRALAYFDLVRFFGDVPMTYSVITNLDDAVQIASTRTPSVEIYNMIEQDLLDAEKDLPDTWAGANAGRVTAGTAKGLLSKVYLTWAGEPLRDVSKYQLAADKAGEVVNNRSRYGYDLEDNYMDVFENDLSKESLFEGQMVQGLGNEGALAGIQFLPRNLTPILGPSYRGNALMRPTPDLINSYDPSDLRLQTAFFTSLSNADGSATATFDPHVFKYIEVEDILYQGLILNDGNRNTKILRFADILLIYAEALNEANSGPTTAAFDAIDEVRNRAGLIDLSTTLSQNDFREAVYLERRLELFAENIRWFDLVRQGRYISTMESFSNTLQDYPNPATASTMVIEKNVQSHFNLLPIPKSQLDILELEEDIQNPGYQ
ncbi:RagB/SusD family nutrient uptake outer membrane protein [Reichenbachiella sp. MALMAid0571]|uniref:RagB/SusD family nutrient uptake outer membrane protein n=1 Tax=Reichenbachiella sp. MALMAid0571 TaxID=3143939 RepID=UPI0032DF865F